MLRNLFKRSGGGDDAQAVHLGAFGKHPGWNDHIDDLGLDTERLINVKRVIYVEGIGANIDSGAWDKLDETQRLDGFSHIFLWRVGGDVLAGRLWSSRDGKGRTKYPMVVCAQCRGVPVRWVLDDVMPALEQIQTRCQATESATEVMSIVEATRRELRAGAAGVGKGAPELLIQKRIIARLADDPGMGGGRDGLMRILYQIEREMEAYRPNGGQAKSRTVDLRPQQIRVPACGENPSSVALQWLQFMYCQLDPVAPVLVIVPVGRQWADVLVGPVQGSQLFCIRATPKAAPVTSDIPYTLDPEFVKRAGESIDAAANDGEIRIQAVSPGAARRFGTVV